MKVRFLLVFAAALVLGVPLAPVALGADLTDVGFVDQADIANLPVFVGANRQLAGVKAQLDGQYSAQIRRARSDAQRQSITLQFQQRLSDKQRDIVGPLLQRVQLAIAAVSATRNLAIVVDKRVIIYGGQDITSDVKTLFSGSQAITPPAASPPPSEIGFVDQNVLDGLPKVQTANNTMNQFEATQRQLYSAKIAQAKSNNDKTQILQQYNKLISDKQDELLKPLVDQTKKATEDVARKKNLMLVVDRADVVYGGTDITSDVQNVLGK